MDISTIREVRFDIYCKKCKYKNVEGSKEPCNSCMEKPVRFGSEKPHKYEDAKSA